MKVFLVLSAVGMGFAGRPGWSVVLAVSAVGLYVLQCVWWPFGYCAWCKGSGRWHQDTKKRRNFRPCWWCGGSGRRLRIVRRIWNRLRGIQSKAS